MPDQISDVSIIAALRRQMTIAAARELVSAGNLANLNTPGYRAQEAVFSDELERQIADSGVVLATTDARHLASPSSIEQDPATREAPGLDMRRDGNTVHLDHELLQMTKAAGEFKAAQTALAAKFRLVRYAITEGR